MLNQSLLRRAFTACLLFVLLAAGLLPGATPARAADPARYFVTPLPHGLLPTCTQADPCKLQAAVDKAVDGDFINIQGGTYTTNAAETDPLLNLNKSVTLRGGWDGAPTGRLVIDPAANPSILDGENDRRVILISGNVSPTLTGLTIRNGNVDVTDGDGTGGAIWINNESSGNVTIDNSIMYDNYAIFYGGGVYLRKGTLTVTNSLIYNNYVTNGGGSFYVAVGANFILEHNRLYYNRTEDGGTDGVLIRVDRGNLTLRGNSISEQTDPDSTISYGSNEGTTFILENNLFTHNAGMVMYQNGSTPWTASILHNTFADNGYMGIYISTSTNGEIANNIFTNHGNDSLRLPAGSTLNVHHNLFWGNDEDPNPGTDAVLADPLLAVDYHLTQDSPAIDAGAATSVRVDYDGEKRPEGVPADIGADEWLLYSYLPLVMKP